MCEGGEGGGEGVYGGGGAVRLGNGNCFII